MNTDSNQLSSSSSLSLASPVLTDRWVTPTYIAVMWQYSSRMIHYWIRSGFLVRRGYTVHQDHHRRWWIRLPDHYVPPPRRISDISDNN